MSAPTVTVTRTVKPRRGDDPDAPAMTVTVETTELTIEDAMRVSGRSRGEIIRRIEAGYLQAIQLSGRRGHYTIPATAWIAHYAAMADASTVQP